jgi:hypothetical protein
LRSEILDKDINPGIPRTVVSFKACDETFVFRHLQQSLSEQDLTEHIPSSFLSALLWTGIVVTKLALVCKTVNGTIPSTIELEFLFVF